MVHAFSLALLLLLEVAQLSQALSVPRNVVPFLCCTECVGGRLTFLTTALQVYLGKSYLKGSVTERSFCKTMAVDQQYGLQINELNAVFNKHAVH